MMSGILRRIDREKYGGSETLPLLRFMGGGGLVRSCSRALVKNPSNRKLTLSV